jgi:tetratricopeptide (TPR) repeat protein
MGKSLGMLGSLAAERGDFDDAIRHSTEAVELLNSDDVAPGTRATAFHNLGVVYERANDARAARACMEEALALSHSVGDEEGVARELVSLGATWLIDEEPESARIALVEGLRLISSKRVAIEFADVAILMLAVVAKARGDATAALQLAAAAEHVVDLRGGVFEGQHRERLDDVRAWAARHLADRDVRALRTTSAGWSFVVAFEYALASID